MSAWDRVYDVLEKRWESETTMRNIKTGELHQSSTYRGSKAELREALMDAVNNKPVKPTEEV